MLTTFLSLKYSGDRWADERGDEYDSSKLSHLMLIFGV